MTSTPSTSSSRQSRSPSYGGAYLVRGGRAERLEGVWEPKRVVVLRFDSFDRAKDWYSSKEYDGPKALRQAASVTNMVLVEGA